MASPPSILNKFFCIVDHRQNVLAALILSYIGSLDGYTPIFEFPTATTFDPEDGVTDYGEHLISVPRAREFRIRVHNALKAIGSCEYLILGGLSDEQKSYLDFLDEYNVIFIDNESDLSRHLAVLCDKKDKLTVRRNEIWYGLNTALRKNCYLEISPKAGEMLPKFKQDGGIVVAEQTEFVASVIAVAYAVSIDADFILIEPPDTSKREVRELIENWKTEKDERYFNDLSALIYNRVENIDFSEYEFGTFFTSGIPYSLVLKNVIPFTYVNDRLDPDFFIFNNLLVAQYGMLDSGVVFSPQAFADEETEFVAKKLHDANYYVQGLIGKDATAYNIGMYVREYPYSIFHICSHGGEVSGYSLKEKFTDRSGDEHEIEYDEVVSFAGKQGEEKIIVTTKEIWRKFDGLVWRSEELKERKYPHYVFEDMVKELGKRENKKRVKKERITDSHAIICSDFNYQAMFNSIAAGQEHPFIFNNTCWSWSGIADSFIGTGAMGYIGTLWAVENSVAKRVAEEFYSQVFDSTILAALQRGFEHTKGTVSENVYVFWGLHFSSLKKGTNPQLSKKKVASIIMRSFNYWNKLLEAGHSDSIEQIVKWCREQLKSHFVEETAEAFVQFLKRKKGF
jgi:hypothetical protein